MSWRFSGSAYCDQLGGARAVARKAWRSWVRMGEWALRTLGAAMAAWGNLARLGRLGGFAILSTEELAMKKLWMKKARGTSGDVRRDGKSGGKLDEDVSTGL